MKKVIILILIFCGLAISQTARPKLIVSVSGEMPIERANILMDNVSNSILKNPNNIYEVKASDQFKEALKKEWNGGYISDDRIKNLAKTIANADFLCLAKIHSDKTLKGNQIVTQLIDLNTMTIKESGGAETEDDFENLPHVTRTILKAVEDMFGTGSRSKQAQTSEGNQLPKDNLKYYSLTDSRDGQKYKAVKIGNLMWMAENLKYETSSSLCYNNDKFNCDKYGRMYDWNSAIKACPRGWHLPSNAEWNDLVNIAGKESAGKNLKSKGIWKNGTDNLGFSAMPGGRRIDGNFEGIDEYGNWWTATEEGSNAYVRFVGNKDDMVGENSRSKSRAYSVRCIQDSDQNKQIPSLSNSSNSATQQQKNQELKSLYNVSRSNFLQGEFAVAYNGFKQIYDSLKTGELAENSLYWMGMCMLYADKKNNAEILFNNLIERFPQSLKVCPANFQLADMAEKSKRPLEQKAYLQTILRTKNCVESNEYQRATEILQKLATPAPTAAFASGNSLTDSRDGQKYRIVKIGNLVWMAENLNYNAKESRCYNDLESNCKKYGKLYNWNTAMKACPTGWHLPDEAEWDNLDKVAGGIRVAGKSLKAKSGWENYREKNGNGSDEYGWSALPGGQWGIYSYFSGIGRYGGWWGASESLNEEAYSRNIDSGLDPVRIDDDNKWNMFSVRCVKN
jgi:uncharacterized protein (TIGR02145 family)